MRMNNNWNKPWVRVGVSGCQVMSLAVVRGFNNVLVSSFLDALHGSLREESIVNRRRTRDCWQPFFSQISIDRKDLGLHFIFFRCSLQKNCPSPSSYRKIQHSAAQSLHQQSTRSTTALRHQRREASQSHSGITSPYSNPPLAFGLGYEH